MNNGVRRIWKFIKWTIISLLFLIVITGATFSIPGVQTSLARIGLDFLKNQYDLTIEIESAHFQFPNVVHLHGVYSPDHRNDTLMYAQDVTFEFSGFANNHLHAGTIGLNGGKLLMRKYETDTLYNFAIWLEHFNDGSVSDSTSPEFKFTIDDIYVSNFHYLKRPIGCDWCTEIDVYDAYVEAHDFELDGSYVSAYVDMLKYKDDHRFNLHYLTGFASFQSNYMELSSLEFQTDASHVVGDAKLKYRKLDEFGDFLNRVVMEGSFKESTISSSEFQSYIPEFPSFDDFTVNGDFKGTVHNLDVTNMDVSLGDTRFFGDVHIEDCTEPDKMFIDAFVGYCETNGSDLNTYVGQFLSDSIPSEIKTLSRINLSGHYTGTLQSFDAKGEIESNLGNANINMKFKDLNNVERVSYEGNLALQSFDLGRISGAQDVGMVTAAGKVKGRGFTVQSAEAVLDLKIAEAEYNHYNYHQIAVDGQVSNRRFEGAFSINDPRVSLGFDGNLDFSKDTAELDFVAILDSADLYTTGFLGDTISWLGGNISADFYMYQDEWWQGQIMVDSVTYRKGNRFHQFEEFVLTSSNAGDITRNAIDSDILNGYIEGSYKLLDIYKPVLKALSSINSNFPFDEEVEQTTAEFNLNFEQPDILTSLLAPGIRIAPGTEIQGEIGSVNDYVELHIETPGIDLYGTYFDTTSFHLTGTTGKYKLLANAKSIFNSVNLTTEGIGLKATLLPDSTTLKFRGLYKDSIDSDVELKGYMLHPSKNVVTFSWDKALFNVGVDTLLLHQPNKLTIEPGRFVFEGYNFEGESGSMSINGFLSKEEYEVLRLELHKLDMSLVNYLLKDPTTEFGGNATGMLILNNVFESPDIAGFLNVDSLSLNKQLLGNLDFNVFWDIVGDVTTMDGNLTLGTLQTMAITGRVASDSTEPLSLDVNLNRFRLACFNPYLLGILDDLRGMVQGNIHIGGSLAKPTLSGEMRLPNAAFSVPFLGTDYNFEGSPMIRLSSDRIILDEVPIRDTEFKTTGLASGTIYHKNLSDLKFDLSIQADRLLGLNTLEGENNYFYGQAFASGLVKIVGPTDQMNLQIDVEAEEGTSIKLPLSSPTEVGQNQFITFVDPTVEENNTAFGFVKKGNVQNLGGLSITVNANMKPEAEVQMLMDESVGGQIKGKGLGLIKIELNSAGDLSILGNYTVTNGSYKFQLRNIVERDFQIKSGSTLNWSGDPFDAQIDLYAVYKTRTTLTGMVSDASGYAGQRVNVELIMHLTGPLMNPNIAFDIQVPNVSSAWQEEMRNRLSNNDKMMDNAFSLLVTNNFWNSDNAVAQDVVTQQVDQMYSVMSNWAAKTVFGDYADLSLNYHSQDQQDQTNPEFEVNISKSFADDRVVVNSNIDIPMGDNPNYAGVTPTVTGDFEVEYKITEDGRIRAKAFNRSNQNNPGLIDLSPYSQGVSVFYRTDFETWDELVEKIFGHKPEEIQPVEEEASEGGEMEVPNATEPADSTNSVTPENL